MATSLAPCSTDPAEERPGSAVFLPVASSLAAKLATVTTLSSTSSQSTDASDTADRRYSDVSLPSERDPPPDLQCTTRLHTLTLRRMDREPAPTPPPYTRFSTTLSSNSLSNLAADTPPPPNHRKRSLIASNEEAARYHYYGVGPENTTGYFSSPYFAPQPTRPQPIRPIVNARPDRRIRAPKAFWNFLTGRSRREKDGLRASSDKYVERSSKREWRTESLRRLRREKSNDLRSSAPAAITDTRGMGRRPRSSNRLSSSSNAAEQPLPSGLHALSGEYSFGKLETQSLRERHAASFVDPLSIREPNSFAAYRRRPLFTTEGSSVSSSSDRDDDVAAHAPEFVHLFRSKKQRSTAHFK